MVNAKISRALIKGGGRSRRGGLDSFGEMTSESLTEMMKLGLESAQFTQRFQDISSSGCENDLPNGVLHKYPRGIARFRKLTKMIIKMMQVVRVFHQQASDTGRPVLVGRLSQIRTSYTGHIPEHPLSFNPKQFSLREYQYRMEPDAKRILQLPWATRTDEQVQRVWLALRFLREFRNMTPRMQVTMARYARYEKHERNRTIVRKGDPGRHYYFIYSGSVELRDCSVGGTENFPRLTAGKDFGHVALLHMTRRTASVVCVEDTEFVVMDRRGNGRAVYRSLLQEHKRKKAFLRSIDIFAEMEDSDMTRLTDHTRINEYLPMSLIASVEEKHPFLYIVVEGVANVALTTDIYKCSKLKDQEESKRLKCPHKSTPLHDVFTQHDPRLSLVIQQIKDCQIFGVQHMLYTSGPKVPSLPILHLLAQSKITVLTLPVHSVMHFCSSEAISILQDRYPIYPSVAALIRRFMEDAVWELYKAHVIRDHFHYRGRVDPALHCKYCLPCQLRSLALPSLLPDPLRAEVSDMFCPGNASPIPGIAVQTFRPRSAPPLAALHRASSPAPAERVRAGSCEPALMEKRPLTASRSLTGNRPATSGAGAGGRRATSGGQLVSRPKTADTRQGRAISLPETASSRPETANSRPETANSRPKTANSRPETANSRPKTANSRPETANSRPKTANIRPKTANSRPETANSRPKTANSRPETASSRPETASSRPETAGSRPLPLIISAAERRLRYRTRIDSLNTVRKNSAQVREIRVNFAVQKTKVLRNAL